MYASVLYTVQAHFQRAHKFCHQQINCSPVACLHRASLPLIDSANVPAGLHHSSASSIPSFPHTLCSSPGDGL